MNRTLKRKLALEEVVDVISRLSHLSDVFSRIDGRKSLEKIAAELHLPYERSTLGRLMDELKEAYGIELTERKGERGALKLGDTDDVQYWIESFQHLVSELVRTKNRLLLLKNQKSVPSISIGTWVGVGLYLIPALVRELMGNEGFSFDLNLGTGTVRDVLSDLSVGRYQFAILPSDEPRAKLLGLIETPLRYRMPAQGLVFLYQRATGDVPFPALKEIVDKPASFSSENLVEVLRRMPMVLKPDEGSRFDTDFASAVSALLARDKNDAGQGQRFVVPNFLTEDQMIRSGMAVGIGNAPEVKAKNVQHRKFPTFKMQLFSDPRGPKNEYAFLPFESLLPFVPEQDWESAQTFSLYQRQLSPLEETGWNARVTSSILDLCGEVDGGRGRKARVSKIKSKYPWLLYDRDEKNPFLIHDLSKVGAP